MQQALQPGQTDLQSTKDFCDFNIASFTIDEYPT